MTPAGSPRSATRAMGRRIATGGLLLLAALAGAPIVAAHGAPAQAVRPQAVDATFVGMAATIIVDMNRDRVARGLVGLRPDARLAQLAGETSRSARRRRRVVARGRRRPLRWQYRRGGSRCRGRRLLVRREH